MIYEDEHGHGDDLYNYEGKIKANFSSNVYFPGREKLLELLCQNIDVVSHYPEPGAEALQRLLAEKHGIAPKDVCVTSGATEAIYGIAGGFNPEKVAAGIADPTFNEYLWACRYHRIASTPIYGLNQLNAIFGDRFKLIWICNPNNPTGRVIPEEMIVEAAERYSDALFIVDHSYEDFTEEKLLSPAEGLKIENMVQIHSMTKRYGIPGLRLGYVTGSPYWTRSIWERRIPWSFNSLALEAGRIIVERGDELVPLDLPALLAERRRLCDRLEELGWITPFESKTHFFLCKISKGDSAGLKEYLARECGILIRDASNFEGLDNSFIRIATQSPAENDMLVEALKGYNGECASA